MLFFGSQLAVILTAIFRGRALGVFAKEAAKVVAVHKSANGSNVFDFEIIPLEQLTRVLQTCLRQIFVEPHVACVLKKMRKVIWRNIKCLRDRFTGQCRGVLLFDVVTNSFK